MSLMIDKLYVNFLSSRLERFKWIRGHVAICRCPICGDGAKGTKTRFYIYENVKYGSTAMNVDCKNCGESKSFHSFLKDFAPDLYKDYRLDLFREKYGREPRDMFKDLGKAQEWAQKIVEERSEPQKLDTVQLAGAVKLSELPRDHHCVKYVIGRLIPEKFLDYLMYTTNFRAVVAEYKNDAEYAQKMREEERLIIPFYNQYGELLCFQGRSLNPADKVRYITIKKHDAVSKIFGMDLVDRSRDVRVCEGPIDSMFIDNCLASADADLTKVPGDVYIFDAQYRNKDVCRHIEKAINGGFKVVLFPKEFLFKDINEAIMAGMTSAEVEALIKTHTYQGMKAKLMFTKLRAC